MGRGRDKREPWGESGQCTMLHVHNKALYAVYANENQHQQISEAEPGGREGADHCPVTQGRSPEWGGIISPKERKPQGFEECEQEARYEHSEGRPEATLAWLLVWDQSFWFSFPLPHSPHVFLLPLAYA